MSAQPAVPQVYHDRERCLCVSAYSIGAVAGLIISWIVANVLFPAQPPTVSMYQEGSITHSRHGGAINTKNCTLTIHSYVEISGLTANYTGITAVLKATIGNNANDQTVAHPLELEDVILNYYSFHSWTLNFNQSYHAPLGPKTKIASYLEMQMKMDWFSIFTGRSGSFYLKIKCPLPSRAVIHKSVSCEVMSW